MPKKNKPRPGRSTAERRYLFKILTERSGHRVNYSWSAERVAALIAEIDPAFHAERETDRPKAFLSEYAARLWAKKQERDAALAARRAAQAERTPYVYIIGNRDAGVCKIGYSLEPEKRVKQVQTGCPYPVSILALFEGKGRDFERALHERAKRFRMSGEWFQIAGPLKDYLDSLPTEKPMESLATK